LTQGADFVSTSSSEEEDVHGSEEEDVHDREEEHEHDSKEDGREQDHWNGNGDEANQVASRTSSSTSAFYQATHVITTRDTLEEFVAA
jgi:hypothetical protein